MPPGTWQVPECPWVIGYPPALLDEIRLAVVDAFFSIPRGGAEIGGVLFGSHTDTEIRIAAFRPMACEHALGPTFMLSENDLARLKEQLESAAADPTLHGLEVVGWYHSHTRSEIFLSEADLAIYNDFFPQPWQVALVLRPAGMKPTRAGFFFRDRQGSIHCSGTYLEFVVTASTDGPRKGNGRPRLVDPPHPVPAQQPPAIPLELNEPKAEVPPESDAPAALPPASAMLQLIKMRAARQPAEIAPPIEMKPAEFVPPAYMQPPAGERSHTRLWIALALLAAAGVAGYFTAGSWMKTLSPKPPALHLQAVDTQGQLRIQWDRAGLASQDVQSGVLEIIDGPATTAVPLDAAKIRLGSFQYARRSEMVEMHMTVRTAKGKSFEEFTSFIGQPPGQASPHDPEKEKQTAELAAEAERARADLKKEELRSVELQRSLDQMRQTMRKDEERKRVENQMPAENPRAAAPPSARTSTPPAPSPTPTPPTLAPSTANQPPTPVQTTPLPKPQPPPPVISQTVKPPAPAQTSVPAQAPPAPKPAVTAPQPPLAPLSGRWSYSAGSASGSPFPPEVTTLNLTESNGQLRGIFSARYRVPKNSKFSGRVTFSFEGPAHAGSSKFSFTASDGMKGDIEIIRLPGRKDAIEVVWKSERDKLTFDDLYFRTP